MNIKGIIDELVDVMDELENQFDILDDINDVIPEVKKTIYILTGKVDKQIDNLRDLMDDIGE